MPSLPKWFLLFYFWAVEQNHNWMDYWTEYKHSHTHTLLCGSKQWSVHTCTKEATKKSVSSKKAARTHHTFNLISDILDMCSYMCARVCACFSLLLLLLFAHSFYYSFYYTNESDTSYVARFNLELNAEFVFRTVCKYISYYRCFCCCCRCWFCWISDWFTTLYDAFRSILYYSIFGKSPPTHTHAHLHTWYIQACVNTCTQSSKPHRIFKRWFIFEIHAFPPQFQ